jgi:hypothetical protein
MAVLQDIKDPTLDRTVAELEANMEPKMKAGYQQIVVAGMKLLFDGKTHHLLQNKLKEAKSSKNFGLGIVKGTAELMAVLYQASKQKMFVPAIVPASVTLMCHILDYAEHAGMIKVTPQLVAEATRVLVPTVLKTFGINRETVATGVDALREQRKAGQGDIPEEYGAFQ